MTDNHKKIRDFLTELLRDKGDPLPFADNEPLFSSGRLDSLNAVKTVVFLEKEFDVDFSAIGFDQELIDTVDALIMLT